MHDAYILLKQLWVVWFFILFLGIVFWVYLPSQRKPMKEHAEIPLRDEDSRQPTQ